MNSVGYREWLDSIFAEKSPRYRKDLVSRAKRVEKAFQKFDENFSFDEEYKKDKGLDLLAKFARFGTCFTWQPHGSQFTIHTDVPENAKKFTIRRPPVLRKETVLESIDFNDDWITIIE